MAGRELRVEIIGDSRSLQKALGKASDASTGFGSKFSKAGKVIGAAALGMGAAVGAGLFVTLKRGFDELAESQKVLAQTEAVIKSTGGAANVSAKQVEGYAESLSKMSGVDDEAIQSGENMLLTFKNIRNEVGAGNDIFKQSTATLLDMSTALGTDMNKSAIQLGKALNDPIKGVAALARVGVTFTAGQKEMIKGMVESGDTMGAQKLILKELNSEFGGSAKAFGETMPGQLSKLKNAFDEVAGELATKFLPMITSVVEWVNAHWPEISAVIGAVGTAISATFKGIGATVTYLRGQWEIHRETAIKTWEAVKTAVLGFINWVKTNLVPPIRSAIAAAMLIWSNFSGEIKTTLDGIVTIIKTFTLNALAPFKIFFALLRGDWQAAWDELKGVVSRTIGAIVTLISGLVSNVLSVAKTLGKAILDGVVAGLAGIVDRIRDQLAYAWTWLRTEGVRLAKEAAIAIGKAIWDGIVDGVKGLVSSGAMENEIKKTIAQAKSGSKPEAESGGKEVGYAFGTGMIAGIAAAKAAVILAAVRSVFDTIAAMKGAAAQHSPSKKTMLIGEGLVEGLIVGMENRTAALSAASQTLVSGASQDIAEAFADIASSVQGAMAESGADSLVDFDVSQLPAAAATVDTFTASVAARDSVAELVSVATRHFQLLLEGLEKYVPPAIAILQLFLDKLNQIREMYLAIAGAADKAGDVMGFDFSQIQGFASGGIVPGPRGRAQLILAHGGETVLPVGARGGGLAVHVNVYGSVTSERDLVASIRNAIIQEGRRSGGNLLGGYG
jgi:hypothetical protein